MGVSIHHFSFFDVLIPLPAGLPTNQTPRKKHHPKLPKKPTLNVWCCHQKSFNVHPSFRREKIKQKMPNVAKVNFEEMRNHFDEADLVTLIEERGGSSAGAGTARGGNAVAAMATP